MTVMSNIFLNKNWSVNRYIVILRLLTQVILLSRDFFLTVYLCPNFASLTKMFLISFHFLSFRNSCVSVWYEPTVNKAITQKSNEEYLLMVTHLSERALADERVDLVSVEELLAMLDDIVVIVVIVTIVVQLSLLLVRAVLALSLLSTPLLLRVVHL